MGNTGDTVTVSCRQGYTGGGTVTCQESGTFNVEIAQCVANACTPKNVDFSNYAVTPATGYTLDVVTVTCDPGYSGGGDIQCLGMFCSLTNLCVFHLFCELST
jgi:hypothetical protein